MLTAVLIGFQYSGSSKLHGTITDLYRMRKYWLSLGFRVFVIGDNVSLPTDLSSLTAMKDIGTDIHRFSLDAVAYDLSSLNAALDPIHDEYLVVYYTGHGTNAGLELPSSELWSNRALKEYLESHARRKAALIIDACGCDGLGLPFVWQNAFNFVLREMWIPWRMEVLLLAASDSKEQALAFGDGSSFTSCLVRSLYSLREGREDALLAKFLAHLSTSLHDLCSSHTPMAYTSRLLPPLVPTWLYSLYDIELTPQGVTLTHLLQVD